MFGSRTHQERYPTGPDTGIGARRPRDTTAKIADITLDDAGANRGWARVDTQRRPREGRDLFTTTRRSIASSGLAATN